MILNEIDEIKCQDKQKKESSMTCTNHAATSCSSSAVDRKELQKKIAREHEQKKQENGGRKSRSIKLSLDVISMKRRSIV